MTSFRSVSSTFKPGQRRKSLAKEWVVQAYERLFKSTGQDAEVVLVDLAEFCGYYDVCPPNVSSEELRYVEGKRAAFAHVLHHLNLAPERRIALEQAAREEATVNGEEGLL